MIMAKIRRTDPTTGDSQWQDYTVPLDAGKKHSVLGMLHYIYTNMDDTLGYSYACRFQRCGLCAMVINDKESLACITLCGEDIKIEPLGNLPLVRDLVVDRRFLLAELRQHRLLPRMHTGEEKGPFARRTVVQNFQHLVKCRECLCCLSSCQRYDYRNTSFGGPFLFVKIAQLAYQESNLGCRTELLRDLGLEQCRTCGECACPVGVPIYRTAIKPFLALL
ncbi:MAG: hypothetical protein A2X92_07360 [Syntrophus sp. GWC2_56_31]|nr:MAG: hypothetical protein A2X92_07360 [Syntrophus sp. GWC2_56_31]